MLALTVANTNDKIYDDNKNMAQLREALIELLLAENAFMTEYSRGEDCVILPIPLRANICKPMWTGK